MDNTRSSDEDHQTLAEKMVIEGVVDAVAEAMYDYGDILDEQSSSRLTIPLLMFVGHRVRITVEVLD
jgi:hypothetical protein